MPSCPICGKYKSLKQQMIDHIESDHASELPEEMTTAQFLYFKIHDRDYGLCRVCGKPTPWNEKAGKPSQICGSPSCKAKIKEIAQSRMLKTYGKVSLLNDIKHQEKMLANRKISGVYTWSDHKHKFIYTGTYEKFAIEWLDKVMNLNPDKIQMPGPILPYKYKNEIRSWITDIYLEDFNLIIEIKAGKDENTHPGFQYQRDLEDAKDEMMLKQKEYNYVKITHKSMIKLIKILAEIRMNNIEVDNNDKQNLVISINESSSNNEELKSYMSNSEINEACDKIINEYTMSVANINPIIPASTKPVEQRVTNDNNNDDFLHRLEKIKETRLDESIAAQTSLFSPNQSDIEWDPLDASNNLIEKNEEIRIDLENDPYDTKVPSPPSEINPEYNASNNFVEIELDNKRSLFK